MSSIIREIKKRSQSSQVQADSEAQSIMTVRINAHTLRGVNHGDVWTWTCVWEAPRRSLRRWEIQSDRQVTLHGRSSFFLLPTKQTRHQVTSHRTRLGQRALGVFTLQGGLLMSRFLLAACAAVAIVATLGESPAEAGPLRRLICGDRGSCGGDGDSCSSGRPVRKLFQRFDERRIERGVSSGCGASTSFDASTPVNSFDEQMALTAISITTPAALTPSSIAQGKAETQARLGVMHHPGGSFGSGTREGVGYSSVSAEDAVRHCCFWGKCEPVEIGVARGQNGWFACVIYR